MTEQKYHRGNVVRVTRRQPGWNMVNQDGTSRQEPDIVEPPRDAVVLASYGDKYGQPGTGGGYEVMWLDDGGTLAWVQEHQMDPITAEEAHGEGEPLIAYLIAAKAERAIYESDLDWIIANWATLRARIPGATICYLMARIGITNPWGARGEGVTYHGNADSAVKALDHLLTVGHRPSIEAHMDFIKSGLPESKTNGWQRPEGEYSYDGKILHAADGSVVQS